MNDPAVICYTVTALVEEPVKMRVLKKSSDATSIQSSSSALHMASTMQETRSSSPSMAQIKFQSMSATSMTSMTSETMVAMSSSSRSMMEMSSHAHVAGSSLRSISYKCKGEETHGDLD